MLVVLMVPAPAPPGVLRIDLPVKVCGNMGSVPLKGMSLFKKKPNLR